MCQLAKIVNILRILALTYILHVYLSNLRNVDDKLWAIPTDLLKLIKTRWSGAWHSKHRRRKHGFDIEKFLGNARNVGTSLSTLYSTFKKLLLLRVSSFLTAHQHIIGYSVPYNGLENAIKDGKYNQGYLATIKYE